jgi:hypothetical protein
MNRLVYLALFALLSPVSGFAKQHPSSTTCPVTEKAILDVEHQLWAAPRNRDVAALDQLLDDSFISVDDGGVRTGKQQALARFRQPEGYMHNETDEKPDDVRLVFTNGVAILSFTKHWTDYDKLAGTTVGATSVMTRVFTCKSGEWKDVALHETSLPNKNRQPYQGALGHLDDYVGHYRLGENGDKGEVSVVRKGNKLFETWAGEEAVEILPGKYDTFFNREDAGFESFVRDKSGKVLAILYTYPDTQFEAKRAP